MPITSADLAALLNDKVINDAFEIARSSRTGILSTVAMGGARQAVQAITRQGTGDDGWWQVCNFAKNPWTGGGLEIFAHIIDSHGYETYLESLHTITELKKVS